MSDFKAKMQQIRFRLGLRPRSPLSPGGAYSTFPGPLAKVKGPTYMGKKGNGREGAGREREGKEKGRKGEEGSGGSRGIGGHAPPYMLEAWQLKFNMHEIWSFD